MELPKKLNEDIWDYCRVNSITDIDGFITKMVRNAFTIEKYGYSPESGGAPQVIETEVIKEVIKEVPVEKVIEVERVVEISNNEELNAYLQEIKELKAKLAKLDGAITVEDIPRSPSSTDENDFYGENTNTKGRFGSNLLD